MQFIYDAFFHLTLVILLLGCLMNLTCEAVGMTPLEQAFTPGMRVEVIGTQGGDLGSYMNAIVLGIDGSNFYPRLRYTGFANAADNVYEPWEGLTHPCVVRPAAPHGMMVSYEVSEEVDVRGVDRYWHGTVLEREGRKYLIRYDLYEPDEWVDVCDLRPHGDWDYLFGWGYLAKYEELLP